MTQEIETGAAAPMTQEEQLAVYGMSEGNEYADAPGDLRHPVTGRIVKSQDGSDEALNVEFSVEPVLDKLATYRAGRNQYRDLDFIRITVPGDNLTTIHTPVTEYYKWRFPVEYAAYKRGQSEVLTGTPLSLWPLLQPSDIKQLEQVGIRTVEQVASLSESHAGALRGFYKLKAQAQQFIEATKSTSAAGEMQRELEAVKRNAEAQMAAMKQQMEEMLNLLKAKAEASDDTTEEATPKKKYGAK